MTAVSTTPSTPPVIPVTEFAPRARAHQEPPIRATRLRVVPPQSTTAAPPVTVPDPADHTTAGPVAPGLTEASDPAAQRSEVEEQTAVLLDRITLARTDDERAALVAEVVVLNLPLADAMARRFRHRGEEEDDLLQVARSGLTEAVLRYRPERGPFGGFAVPTVLGVLKRHFRDRGWMVRPPRHQQEIVLAIRRVWPELTQQLAAEPTDVQLAQHLGETVETISRARLAEQGYRPAAVDLGTADHGPRGGISRGDGPGDDEDASLAACEARLLVDEAVAGLDEADRRLIWMRFHQERTQSDIAAELGTSQMQVSRLLARVMGRLRTSIGSLDESGSADPSRATAGAQSSVRSQVQTSGAPRSST